MTAPYDAVICDLDGCVWVGDRATPGAVEALAGWRERGRRVVFVTNEPRRGPEAQVQRLWKLGIRASSHEVITVIDAVQAHLAERHAGRTVFVIGTETMIRHVIAAGLRPTNNADPRIAARSEVVVVASHDAFTYAELRIAVRAVLNGAHLVAAGRDRTFPMPDGPWPGSGAILAAVEYATGRTARSLGKPEPDLFHMALEHLDGCRVLAVGDRLDGDVAGAAAAGLDAALVLTGASDEAALAAWTGPAPTIVAPTLAELLAGLD